MQLIQKISLDFAENGIPPKIVGKQDDSGASRSVAISLYNAGVAFEIPSGAAFMLRYKTPSGAYGLYDTMPDGSAAMAAEENRVTVQLVDQIFAAPGLVSCELRIIADGAGVSTWKWYVDVEGSYAADATIPSDYINVFSSIAAEVAANADRAEQAAAAIVPEALLYKADYDPTGEVAADGGITAYVSNAMRVVPSVASDIDTTVDTGVYSIGDSTENKPSDITSGILQVISASETTILQIATSTDGYRCRRVTTDYPNSWGEWEWENPRMADGTEYRTTERYDGSAVYAKKVSQTLSISAGTSGGGYVYTQVPNSSKLIRLVGCIYPIGSTDKYLLPYFNIPTSGNINSYFIPIDLTISGSISYIFKSSTSDTILPSATIEVTIYYTKS